MIESYAKTVLRFRWLVIVVTVVIMLLLASGGRFLVFTNDYRVFFGPDNPQLLAFDDLQETYTKSDNLFIMMEPDSGTVFDKSTMAAIVDATERSWQIPYSIRVDSISNFQHTRAEEDDMFVEELIEEPELFEQADIERIQAIALDQPQLVNKLVSTSAAVTGINITVELPAPLTEEDKLLSAEDRAAKDPNIALGVAMNAGREMVAQLQADYPDIKFHTTGIVAMNQAFPEAITADAKSLLPMAFLVVIVGVILFLRNVFSMIGTVIVILFSILMAMGTAGWLGILLTPPAASAPTVILTLAVADCVHFLVTMLQNMREKMPKNEAIIESLRVNFTPIFLTSVTTAIGFLSMNFSDSPPFHDLGNIVALGVGFAFFLAVVFLPALMSVLPVNVKAQTKTKSTAMERFADFVIAKQKLLLWGMAIVMIGFSVLAPKNQLNDVFVNYFDRTVPFRVATDEVTDKLSGLYILEFDLDSGEEGGVGNPDFLQDVEKFERYVETLDGVQHVSTITETMRRLNRSMHGDDDAYYKLPEERELAAQYLLFYEMSLPSGLDLNNQINQDKSKTRMSVTMETRSTQQVLEFERQTMEWMQANTPAIATLTTGATSMFTHISMRNIISMLSGTSIALVLISLILLVALRSIKFGLISLIPNIVPALMGFGVWALLVGEVSLAVSVVVAMTLGIVVDDTIHYLSKYLRARRERGMSPEQAVRYAFNTVGVALVVTTIVLACGFMVLAQSNFLLNSQMGLLTAITIVIALIVDFTFLPAFLMVVDKDNTDETSTSDMPITPSGQTA